MGTPCACTISDIFICNFMNNAIKDQILKPLYYKQYRDDGFGIWEHGLEKLQEFCNQLNKIHPKIQFTLTTTKTLSYLDLNLEITPFGTISSETAYKSTETFNYLHYDSNHPAHTRNNINTIHTSHTSTQNQAKQNRANTNHTIRRQEEQ